MDDTSWARDLAMTMLRPERNGPASGTARHIVSADAEMLQRLASRVGAMLTRLFARLQDDRA